jgi:hypothetical protein
VKIYCKYTSSTTPINLLSERERNSQKIKILNDNNRFIKKLLQNNGPKPFAKR